MKEDKTKIEITKNETGLNLEYDDISPFTGNNCVLIEADEKTNAESRICMESGYTTCDVFTPGSDALKEYELYIPQLYKDTKFTDSLLEREEFMSTGLGFEIAFPHCKNDSVIDFFLTIGISSARINQNAFDGSNVKLIFMKGGLVEQQDK